MITSSYYNEALKVQFMYVKFNTGFCLIINLIPCLHIFLTRVLLILLLFHTECHKRPGRATGRSTRKKEAGLSYKGVVLTFALLTVLAGFKLKGAFSSV